MARFLKATKTAVEEGTLDKFIHVPGLILSTIVSILILVGLERNWVIDGDSKAYHAITNAQTATQQVVTITATIFGTIYASAVAKLINQATRIILSRQPTSVHRLKLWYVLSTISLDRSVRWTELPLVVGVYLMLSQGPSTLWSGSIAPVNAVTVNTQASIALPQYTGNSYRYWSQNAFYPNSFSASFISPKGTFTYLPLLDRLGYLIVDGSSATSTNGLPQVHSKNDNSNYTYIGRSYGVGSSVGLTDEVLQNTTLNYQYSEVGYKAAVDCMYNTTSRVRLLLIQPGRNGQNVVVQGVTIPLWATPYVYLATGSGPNAPPDNCTQDTVETCGGFTVAGGSGDQEIVAAGWWASPESGLQFGGFPNPNNYVGKTRPVLSKSFTALTAGSGNQNLNQVQCSISMIPTSFTVKVNSVERKISVTPRNDSNVVDIEPTGFIADSAASVLGIMSSLDMSSKTSVIGSILRSNIHNKMAQQARPDQSQLQDVVTLQGIAEAMETLIDDSLLATASAQLMIANDSYSTNPTVYRKGLRIGDKRVVIILVIANTLIIVLYVEEALRTRNWKSLSKFNYSNIESIMVAASLGGSALGDAVLNNSDWVGGDLREAAGNLKVVASHGNYVQLGLAGEEMNGQVSHERIELITSKHAPLPQ